MDVRAIDALAEFIVETTENDIPPDSRERAWDCVLDAIGAAAAGFGQRSSASMRRAFAENTRSQPSSVWFDGATARLPAAAAANAMAATALDVDDGHRMAAGHPGAAAVCAALAAAEHTAPTRGEFIAAVALGLDAAVRVAMARNPDFHRSTVSGRWSGVGAAVAAAKLFELDSPSVANAILIAEQHAPRVSAAKHHGFAGSDVKEGIAWSVYTGLEAVPLAREGFKGYPNAFDQGILYDRDRLIAKIDEFESINGLFFKPYACCRWTHAAIDGAVSLVRKSEIEPASIEKISIGTFRQAVKISNLPAPTSESEAQFSIPFCVSLAILHGTKSLLPMDSRHLVDREVRRLAKRVQVSLDGEMAQLFPALAGAKVTIAHGSKCDSIRVEAPWGDPTNPMSRESLLAKFRQLTRFCLKGKRAEELIRDMFESKTAPASIGASLRAKFQE
ncbi:MAG: MmgE/PrpD family protein [Albidovulum sp.]|nr:MmgE/PrpD family protein [Albidovulum sp.]